MHHLKQLVSRVKSCIIFEKIDHMLLTKLVSKNSILILRCTLKKTAAMPC